MTKASHGPSEPMTDEEFHCQLTQLLQTAAANGVDVRGGWACQTEDDNTDWDIEIIDSSGTPTTNR